MCGDACWLGGATGHSPRPETARRGCKMDWDGPAVSPLGGRKSALSAPGRPPLDERTSANSTHPTRLRLRFGHTGAAHYAQRDNVVPSAVAAARETGGGSPRRRLQHKNALCAFGCVLAQVSTNKKKGGRGRRAEQLYVAQLTFGLLPHDDDDVTAPPTGVANGPRPNCRSRCGIVRGGTTMGYYCCTRQWDACHPYIAPKPSYTCLFNGCRLCL